MKLTRKQINKKLEAINDKIQSLLADKDFLIKEKCLLNDGVTRYVEKEEEIMVRKRPKKMEKQIRGYVQWDEDFIDEDTGNVVTIERHQLVKVNGEWVI